MNPNSTDSREVQKFGVIALLFFGSLCALGFLTNKLFPTYLFGFLSIFGLVFILIPSPLRLVYATWLKIAHFLGRIVTALILTLTYYMVLTPLALIKRLIGAPPLLVKSDKRVLSYWVTRTEPAQPKERFLRRF